MMACSLPTHSVTPAKAGAYPEVLPFMPCHSRHLRMDPGLRRDDIAFVEALAP